MIELLLHIKKKAHSRTDGKIDPRRQGRYRPKYRDLLAMAERMDPAQKRQGDPNRNIVKQSKTFKPIARLKRAVEFMNNRSLVATAIKQAAGPLETLALPTTASSCAWTAA